MSDLIGKRVRLIQMNDPNPIPPGSEGIVWNVGGGIINVDWDNGRHLGIIIDVDSFEIIG